MAVSAKKNITFCSGKTLILTYGSQLFTVGLLEWDLMAPPIVHQYSTAIREIEAVVYDPIRGEYLKKTHIVLL